MMNFTVLIHNEEDGGFWAEVQELPGCVTQGDTEEELEANLKEVIELFLEGLIDDYIEGLIDKVEHEPADATWHMSMTSKRTKAAAKA